MAAVLISVIGVWIVAVRVLGRQFVQLTSPAVLKNPEPEVSVLQENNVSLPLTT